MENDKFLITPLFAIAIKVGLWYDMHTTAEKDLLWWGGENDTYLRQADSQ